MENLEFERYSEMTIVSLNALSIEALSVTLFSLEKHFTLRDYGVIITLVIMTNYNYDREKDQYPKTLLGNKEKRQVFWDEEDQEYFFDRHYYSFRQGFTHL